MSELPPACGQMHHRWGTWAVHVAHPSYRFPVCFHADSRDRAKLYATLLALKGAKIAGIYRFKPRARTWTPVGPVDLDIPQP